MINIMGLYSSKYQKSTMFFFLNESLRQKEVYSRKVVPILKKKKIGFSSNYRNLAENKINNPPRTTRNVPLIRSY